MCGEIVRLWTSRIPRLLVECLFVPTQCIDRAWVSIVCGLIFLNCRLECGLFENMMGSTASRYLYSYERR